MSIFISLLLIYQLFTHSLTHLLDSPSQLFNLAMIGFLICSLYLGEKNSTMRWGFGGDGGRCWGLGWGIGGEGGVRGEGEMVGRGGEERRKEG